MATARKPKPAPTPAPRQVMRDCRLRARVSQAELAKALGVSQPAISGFESGAPGGPWLSNVKLWEFTKLFEVDPKAMGLAEEECCPTCGRSL